MLHLNVDLIEWRKDEEEKKGGEQIRSSFFFSKHLIYVYNFCYYLYSYIITIYL